MKKYLMKIRKCSSDSKNISPDTPYLMHTQFICFKARPNSINKFISEMYFRKISKNKLPSNFKPPTYDMFYVFSL